MDSHTNGHNDTCAKHTDDSQSLTGKIALITGGSKGIGKGVAIALARAGAQVVFTYLSDSSAAEALVTQIGIDKAVAIKSDASRMEDIEELIKETAWRFGRIDILIANAAVSPSKDLAGTTETDFDRAFAMNVKGPFFLVQKAAPLMPPRSRVILVSSSMNATSQIWPDKLVYCSTKGAIEQMARLLAKDLGRRDIAVNCIAPGATATELFYEGKPEHIIKAIAGFSPYNRIGTVEETASVFLYLSGSGSQWLTGQTIRINGGAA